MSAWFFSILLLSFAARAGETCAPVDLRPRIGAPLDQGDSSYCFAHTASSLIQARIGIRVSPMQLATHYILASPHELRGTVPPSVRERVTPEFLRLWRKDLYDQAANFTAERILGESGLLDTGGEEVPTILIANYLGLCPESRLPTGPDVYLNYLESIRAFHAERALRGIPPHELAGPVGVVSDPEARGKAWSYRHWVESRCGARWKPSMPLLPRMTSLAQNLRAFRRLQAGDLTPSPHIVVDAINASLSRGQPVSIGYAMADVIPAKAMAGADEVDHASVIAARKKGRDGRCYYFLRNSFGNDLEGYHPRFAGRLESGGAWILPEEIPSLYNVVWLE